MPHIELPELPGIVGLLVQYPQTAGPLNGLADALLRGPSSLSRADRETIAAFVSTRNECTFCAGVHGAVARHLHESGEAAGAHGETGAKTKAAGVPGSVSKAASGSFGGADAGTGTVSGAGAVDDVMENGSAADVGPKLQALLAIAEKVRVDGRSVSTADVERARAAGADDKAVHDTVLIAAAFCMFNRYVDGLATLTPERPEDYARHAKNLAEGGYLQEP